MAAKRPKIYYLEWEPQTYLAHTVCLSNDADLIYRRIIDQYFIQRGLPSDPAQLCKYARYEQSIFEKCWLEILQLPDGPYVKGDRIIIEKVDRNINRIKEKSEKARMAVEQRERRRAEKKQANKETIERLSNDDQTIIHTDIDIDIKEKQEKESYPQAKNLGTASTDVDENRSQKVKTKKKSTNGRTGDDPKLFGFDEFWSHYPRKVGKVKARSAWRTQNCAKIATEIIEDVKYRADNLWEDSQFVPYPATYINGRRWEDERETATATAPKPKPKPHEPRPHIPDVTGCGITERKPLTDDQRDQLREIKQALHGCFRKIEK